MARLLQSGFEENSLTTGVEFDTISASVPTIQTGTVHGAGTYAMEITSLTSTHAKGVAVQYQSASGIANIYVRFYINIATLPNNSSVIMTFGTPTAPSTTNIYVKLTSAGALQMFLSGAQQGSNSSTLSTNTWYRVELHYGNTGTGATDSAELLLNGVSQASTSSLTISNTYGIFFGGNLNSQAYTATTGDWFIDDIAINDTSGSNQTGYPGAGQIVVVRPNGAGDANAFAVQVGGTLLSANNYTRVDEVTPDDATSYNASAVLNAQDLFTVGSSGVGASDTVNVVAVNFRTANITGADNTTAIEAQIEKKSGGTITSSAALEPDSTTWTTNINFGAQVGFPAIVTYADPDGAAWTSTTLGTMQIGYQITAAHTDAIGVTAIWASIDYTPASGSSVNVNDTTTTSENVVVFIPILVPNVADTTTTSENVVFDGPANPSLTDTTTTSENIVPEVVSFVNTSDLTTTSESQKLELFSNISPADTATTSESQGFLELSYIAPADTTTTSETVTVVLPSAGTDIISSNDTATTSENVVLYITTLFISVGDNTTTSENIITEAIDLVSGGDTTTTSENTGIELISLVSPADTTTTSENVAVNLGVTVDAADTTTTSENVVMVVANYNLDVDDTTTSFEGIVLMLNEAFSVSDTTTTSEAQDIEEISLVATGDTTTSSEHVNVTIPILLIVAGDTTTTSENVQLILPIIGTFTLTVSDTTTTSEHDVVIEPTLLIPASDTTTTSENSNLFEANYLISVSDMTTTSEQNSFSFGSGPTLLINTSDTSTSTEVVSAGYVTPPVPDVYPTPNIPTTLIAPQVTRSLPLGGYEFWILTGDPTRITKILTPYPLDATGTIMQFSNELDDFGQARFRVSAYDTVLKQFGDILVPHENWIQIVKNGVIVWQGPIIENVKRTKDYIECIAAEPLWYLNKVMITRSSIDPGNASAIDPTTGAANGLDGIYRIFNTGTMSQAVTDIMNETIATFQANDAGHPLSGLALGTVTNPNYPPNVTNGASPPINLTGPWQFGDGILAPDLQFDYQTILYVLKSFGAYTYADYYIDENLVFNFVPFKGNNLTTTLNFTWGATSGTPSNLVDYNIPRLGQRMVNHLYGIATDVNGNVLHYDQSDNASIATYGYIEGVAAYSDVKDQATLAARIQAELPLISTPDNAAITITQSEKGYPLGTYSVGDIININVNNKAISFSDNRRIVGISVQVNGTGRETIQIQTNKVLPWQFALAGGTDITSQTT